MSDPFEGQGSGCRSLLLNWSPSLNMMENTAMKTRFSKFHHGSLGEDFSKFGSFSDGLQKSWALPQHWISLEKTAGHSLRTK